MNMVAPTAKDILTKIVVDIATKDAKSLLGL